MNPSRTQAILSNVLMATGSLPSIAALFLFVAISRARGDRALGLAFYFVFGYGLAYLATLLLALPAALYSRAASERWGDASAWPARLRRCVVVALCSPLILVVLMAVLGVS